MSPVSASEKEALRRNLGISPAVMAIGVVGALMAKKQQLKLLRHLVANPAQVPSAAHFFLIGDCNPETDEYSRLCVQTVRGSALAERIHLVGYSDSIRDWYRALDVVLVASAKEGLARAMIESLACGTPVTSFDCCSACEVLEAEGCGLVAPMGDFDGLMKQLVRIASDPAMRTVLSQRARQVAVRLFEPKKVVSVYEGVYLQLLKKSRF